MKVRVLLILALAILADSSQSYGQVICQDLSRVGVFFERARGEWEGASILSENRSTTPDQNVWVDQDGDLDLEIDSRRSFTLQHKNQIGSEITIWQTHFSLSADQQTLFIGDLSGYPTLVLRCEPHLLEIVVAQFDAILGYRYEDTYRYEILEDGSLEGEESRVRLPNPPLRSLEFRLQRARR